MTRIKLIVSYDGTDFMGWQKQNHGIKKGIQEVLEQAISKILNQEIHIFGSGRTDAGVHALGQVVHFDCLKPVEHFQKWDFPWAINHHLPSSISVKHAYVAPPEFHATLSATHKTYRYLIWNHPRRSALFCRYSAWIRKPLDLEYLHDSSQLFKGEKDFKSMQSVGTPVSHTVRTIYKTQWKRLKPHLIEFQITGSGFLKQMVRNIVGTQLLLEKTQSPMKKITEILESLDRTQAGPPAPPEGLYLKRVFYPLELDKQCIEI